MNKKGFTLIELLVVIAIIGLLSTLAVVALGNARQKSRDARRISDVKQIQTALELYMNDIGQYPTPPGAAGCYAASGDGDISGCCISTTNGIDDDCAGTTYMGSVPYDPSSTSGAPVDYVMTQLTTATYSILYTLEGTTANITAGDHHATPAGICDDTTGC